MSAPPYTNDLDVLRTWIGRTEERVDVISARSCLPLAHTLDKDIALADGDPLPPLWHFIAHAGSTPTRELGTDGHPKRGGFLPPVALPRRMWAGSRLTFHGDIQLGDEVLKRSTVENVTMKDGRSGLLCFVTVSHELLVDGDLRIAEQQDLVYKDDAAPNTPKPEPTPAPEAFDFTRSVTPSAPMLFRYSALMFNSHRIHYDRTYARDVEGYPNLVVHGPLTASLLADLAATETGKQLTAFSFRGVAPLFDDAPFTISGTRDGDNVELWASTPGGGVAMRATATLA